MCLRMEGGMKEINRDRNRQLWHIISTGLWIDVQFVRRLWKHLDRLSGAPRGRVLEAAYRNLLILFPFFAAPSIHSTSFFSSLSHSPSP